MLHSADRQKAFVAMAPVFQTLISLFTLPGQTGSVSTLTDSSSLSSKRYVYNTLSEYVTLKLNSNITTFGIDENAHGRVSATGSDVNYTAVDNAGTTGNSDSIRTATDLSLIHI